MQAWETIQKTLNHIEEHVNGFRLGKESSKEVIPQHLTQLAFPTYYTALVHKERTRSRRLRLN